MTTRSVMDVSRAADGRSAAMPDVVAKSSLADGSARRRGRFGDGPVSGAAVMITGKIANFAVAFVSLAIVARILSPADYGLVAMVASATAFFSIFSDFGLSLVTVQRPHLSAQQLSTLFWINVGFGLLLGLLASLFLALGFDVGHQHPDHRVHVDVVLRHWAPPP